MQGKAQGTVSIGGQSPVQNQAAVAYVPAVGHTPILPLVLHPYLLPFISTLICRLVLRHKNSLLSRKMFPGRALFAALLCFSLTIQLGVSFAPFNVSYDHRALLIDGKRRMLVSAGIHYPRATPEVPTPPLLVFLGLFDCWEKFLGYKVLNHWFFYFLFFLFD